MNVDDLKTAVAEALASVRELKQMIDATDAEVDEKMATLAALDTSRETAAQNLETACEQATKSARQGETDLRDAGGAARDAIAEARSAVVTDAESVVDALGKGRGASIAQSGEVNEADVELQERLADVEREIRALASQAATLTAEVEQATQEADRLLQEQAQGLQRLLQEVDARVKQVLETVRTDCALPIEEDAARAIIRLEDVSRTALESLGVAGSHSAGGHAEESADYCVQESGRELTDALTRLDVEARRVTSALDDLRERTDEARQTAVEAAGQMNKALTQGTSSLESAMSHIDGVLGVLGELGFTI